MKFTRFLIAGALVALLAACSHGGSGESQKAPAATPSKPAMQEPAKAPAATSSSAMTPAESSSSAMAPATSGSAAMKPAASSSSM